VPRTFRKENFEDLETFVILFTSYCRISLKSDFLSYKSIYKLKKKYMGSIEGGNKSPHHIFAAALTRPDCARTA